MLNTMRIQRDAVALEAFLVSDMTRLLKDVFPTLLKEFNGAVTHFIPEAPAVVLTSKQNDFIKELTKHKYSDIAPLTAFVPEGMNVTYLKYAEALSPAVMHSANTLQSTLSDYTLFLSKLITNVEQQLDTGSFDVKYKSLAKERAELNSALGDCFKSGSSKTEVSIGDVVDRNNDWVLVFHNGSNANNAIMNVDRKILNKKIAECSHLLGVVNDKIKRGDFANMSGQAVKNLSDGAYQVASELEFFSVMFYKTLAFTESVNRTVLNFQKIITQ